MTFITKLQKAQEQLEPRDRYRNGTQWFLSLPQEEQDAIVHATKILPARQVFEIISSPEAGEYQFPFQLWTFYELMRNNKSIFEGEDK